jgi:crotonobetaine/carnitine-CoA ligase
VTALPSTPPPSTTPPSESLPSESLPFAPLPRLLRERAASDRGRVFLQEVTGAACTYGELEESVRRWMAVLRQAGVGPGDYVLSMLPTGIACVTVWLAVARLGAVEVPVNTAYHGPVLAAVAEDSTARVAVVDGRWSERFSETDSPVLHGMTVIAVGAGSQPHSFCGLDGSDHGGSGSGETDLAEHDVATVVFTSGTTGRSKGVLIPWRQLRESARWCIPLDDAGPDDHWYVPLPLFHVSGKLSLYAAALTGARAVLRETFSTSAFWPDIKRFGVTTTLLAGGAARYLESQPARPDDLDNPLRNVFVAPFPVDPDGFAARFGVRLTTAFNMTELSCPIVSGWDLGPAGSCGRPRSGVACRIVNSDDRELPVGEVGELIVRTSEPWETMLGYLGAPEATTAAWRNLWFHTGDRCRRDADGYFYFVDRGSDAIRRRGENVSSTDVEAALAGHPDIAESAVVGVPSPWGEHDIKAFVVPRPGSSPDPADIAAYAERELPRFMVPRYVVVVPDLPKTPTNRVQKARLRDWAGDAPTHDRGR